MASSIDTSTSNCASCGKEGGDSLKACTACNLVKYCNRECQIAHRPLHKRACRKRAAELHDEALFKEHPHSEDCPICFLPSPVDTDHTTFQSCYGKIICNGCIHVMGICLCAFFREPYPTSAEDEVKRINKCAESGNAYAFYNLAEYEVMGMPQDIEKSNELLLKAGELGCAEACSNLGNSYNNGRGVGVDIKKAKSVFTLVRKLLRREK